MQKRVKELSAELEDTRTQLSLRNSTLHLADVQIKQLEALQEYNLDAEPILGGMWYNAPLRHILGQGHLYT